MLIMLHFPDVLIIYSTSYVRYVGAYGACRSVTQVCRIYTLERCKMALFGGDSLAVNSLPTLLNTDRTPEAMSWMNWFCKQTRKDKKGTSILKGKPLYCPKG